MRRDQAGSNDLTGLALILCGVGVILLGHWGRPA
jgi:hypothetical protein